MQIRKLEEEIGVDLLAREGRGTKITEAGRAFLPQARKSLADAQLGASLARRAAHGEIGQLSIGYNTPTEFRVFPRVIPAFRQQAPNIHLSFHDLKTVQIIEEHESVLDLHHECIATITSALNQHHIGIRQLAGWKGKGNGDPWKAFLSKYMRENDELTAKIADKERIIQSLEERLRACEKHQEKDSQRLYGEPVSSSEEEEEDAESGGAYIEEPEMDDKAGLEDAPIDANDDLEANIVDKHAKPSLFQWIGGMFTH